MKRDAPGRSALSQSRPDTDGDEAQVDLGPLTDMIGYTLRRAQLASFKSFKQAFDAVGITPAQYSVLLIIELNPGLRQTQVSDALGIKRANFVGLIDALEKRGLAVRTPAVDRRSHALHLTEQGRKFLKPLRALNAAHEARLCAALGEHGRESLVAALKAIATSVENGADGDSSPDDEI